jgi:hypothetical protein
LSGAMKVAYPLFFALSGPFFIYSVNPTPHSAKVPFRPFCPEPCLF